VTKNGERLFVITGGPGSGKSALIEALKQAGYATSVEAGRGIIQDQVVIGGSALPWSDPTLFAETMLCWEMRSYHIARDERGPVFFDRGVPDVLGYLTLMRLPVPEYMRRAADIFRYNRRAFVAPPWAEIFQQDRERKQNFDEAKRTHHAMVATYTDLGYQLVEIPRASVEARVRFILHHVGLASAGCDSVA
jgi:predicted ATPase